MGSRCIAWPKAIFRLRQAHAGGDVFANHCEALTTKPPDIAGKCSHVPPRLFVSCRNQCLCLFVLFLRQNHRWIYPDFAGRIPSVVRLLISADSHTAPARYIRIYRMTRTVITVVIAHVPVDRFWNIAKSSTLIRYFVGYLVYSVYACAFGKNDIELKPSRRLLRVTRFLFGFWSSRGHQGDPANYFENDLREYCRIT